MQVNETLVTVRNRERPSRMARRWHGRARVQPARLLASSRPRTPPGVKGGRRPSRSDASGSEHPWCWVGWPRIRPAGQAEPMGRRYVGVSGRAFPSSAGCSPLASVSLRSVSCSVAIEDALFVVVRSSPVLSRPWGTGPSTPASLPDPREAIRSDNHPNCFGSVRLLARAAFEVAVRLPAHPDLVRPGRGLTMLVGVRGEPQRAPPGPVTYFRSTLVKMSVSPMPVWLKALLRPSVQTG